MKVHKLTQEQINESIRRDVDKMPISEEMKESVYLANTDQVEWEGPYTLEEFKTQLRKLEEEVERERNNE
jgi:hypothetical protein